MVSLSIGLIAVSVIADDPRVRRQGDAFRQEGWRVFAAGLPGGRSGAVPWETASVANRPGLDPESSRFGTWTRRIRNAGRRAGVLAAPSRAETVYWTVDPTFARLYEAARGFRADLWLANDWTALPIASRLAREQGTPFIYDTHELASDEYAERLTWRILHRPGIVALERTFLREAALVTCVSDGIADRLQELYGLGERPLVVRNTPPYESLPFRPTGERIEVLYHGVVSPGRGLEACLRSVALWRPEFRLTIRGPAAEAYRARLEREIAAFGVADRVRLVPPVPMTGLVKAAAPFDVGLFALPGSSRHNRFALPNKVFEYVMAGLALCISDLPEMARLVRIHDLGPLIPSVSPEAIAAAINTLDRAAIDRHKRNALTAARELNWERESGRLVARCAAIASHASSRPG